MFHPIEKLYRNEIKPVLGWTWVFLIVPCEEEK
jgi:hypothetical protein